MSHVTLFARVARASLAAAACLVFVDSTTDAQIAAPAATTPPPAAAPLPTTAPATETRTIQHIVVLGTQRIEPATVLSYISLHEGDVYSEQTSDLALKTLYQTGLFADVRVKFDGATLTVSVVENPII